MKLTTLLTLCVLGATAQLDDKQKSVPAQMRISMYFEGQCPDCHEYLRNQLLQVWEGPMSRTNQTVLELVPFGNAEQRYEDGRWRFSCQHGPEECLYNKLYACAIMQACGEGGTVGCLRPRLDQVLRYILCVAQESDQMEATSQCTSKMADLTADYIVPCARSEQGSLLLNRYGNLTAAVSPAIEYVPHININNEHDTGAEDSLMKRVCELRPDLC